MYTIDVADQVLKFKKNLRSLKIIIAENQSVLSNKLANQAWIQCSLRFLR